MIEVQREDAYDGGWLLHDRQDPATTPVLIAAEFWYLLTDLGGYREVQP